jgi:hypothetical protein
MYSTTWKSFGGGGGDNNDDGGGGGGEGLLYDQPPGSMTASPT